MSDLSNRIAALSPEKRALLARRLKGEVPAPKGGEPLAIVGIGLRFSGGADTPESLWSLLENRIDAVSEVPPERWDIEAFFDSTQTRPGTTTSRWGSWLPRLDEFDAGFFGLSPREAARMDPQQRLLLEVAFEALEDAGQRVEDLAGSLTGVYVGTQGNDYSWKVFGDAAALDAYASTGSAHSIIANRLSYVWDLRGPSLAIDTACSASLVAVHQACQGLRNHDCDLALAAGVNLVLSPLWTIAVSKLGMLSPRGRCRAFDASADGIVRGEGCGVLALKRLSDAVAAGDRIWAVIRGTTTNQDGRTNGITAPNGLSQQAMLRAALQDAGLTGDAISAVEAHGTGTVLGDPIEVEALAEVLGKGDPATHPCFLGSIKTNVGHLEAAAGIAGLIKLVVSLSREAWPGLVHFESLNPHIETAGTRFVFPRECRPWPRGPVPRRGGVSAFGFGGSNAHVIVEESPAAAPVPRAEPVGPRLMVVSARTGDALRERARDLARFLEGSGRTVSLDDVSATTLLRRSRHEHGASVAGGERSQIIERLRAVADGASPLGAAVVVRPPGRPVGVGFVFSGQGSQWPGMATALAETDAGFAAALSDCDSAIRAEAGWSVLEELARPIESSRLGQTEYAQPAIFAVQVALTRWLAGRGIVPDVVIGHSVGEIAAAHAAGILDLPQAARVVVLRARLMQAATGAGRMVAVEGPPASMADVVERSAGAVSWAAFNSPTSRVLSGEPAAVEAATAFLAARGLACKALPVDYAFHSSQMEPFAEALAAELDGLKPAQSRLRFLSTVTGGPGDDPVATPDYWRRNVRQPVQFEAAVASAARHGVRHFVEIGPHMVLTRALRQCLEASASDGGVLPTLHREENGVCSLLSTLGALSLLGREIRWDRVAPAEGRVVSLPGYPWQREKFPLPRFESAALTLTGAASEGILGVRLPTAIDTFESRFSADEPPWFADHVIQGAPTLPASGFAVLASEAASRLLGPGPHAVEDLVIGEPFRVLPDGTHRLQVACVRETADVCSFRAFGLTAGGDSRWVQHASARLVRSAMVAPIVPDPPAGGVGLPGKQRYDDLARRGAAFGPGYRTVQRLSLDPTVAVGEVAVPATLTAIGQAPALVDGALQVASALLPADEHETALSVPFSLARVRMRASLPERFHVSARRSPGQSESLDIVAFDDDGAEVLSIEGARFRRLQPGVAQSSVAAVPLYGVEWREQPRRSTPRPIPSEVVVLDRNSPLPPPGLQVVAFRAAPQNSIAFKPEDLPDVESDTRALLALVQTLLAHSKPPRLAVVTRGARAISSAEIPDLASAPLLGLTQVIGAEHPELGAVSIDLDPDSADEGAALAEELGEDDGEEAVAIRSGRRFVARLRPLPVTGTSAPRRLAKGEPAIIDSLHFESLERRQPQAGEVELEVLAAGLNFRDVLNALGLYPGDPVPLGNECAGVVTAVGTGVADLRVGDTVMGVGFGSLASHAVVDSRLVVPKPAHLPVLDAAAIPIAFLTADYALNHLASMKAGDLVLIHAAAGGVGLAAVELARAAGATVFATAGSDEKRAFLCGRGVTHVFDSRTLTFAEGVRAATQGRGVDIVLNSLAGDFIARSLEVLAPDGRFVEIGRRGIWTAEQVREIRPDATYHVLYLGDVCVDDPALVRERLLALVRDLSAGRFRPLPVRGWPADEAHEAFRFMAQAKHIGKLVLDFGRRQAVSDIRPDATYVVTGGLGGVGLAVAESLVARGARHLALLGRSAPGQQARETIARLEALGAQVRAVAVDVSAYDALSTALLDIEKDAPPVAGIVHAAGVLDDGPIVTQDWSRFAAVLAPKVGGAWNLHRWSVGRRLDFFSLFSSSAALLGWAGQSSYAAANAFLDSLACFRQALGLPAQSFNWGAWKDVGMAASLGEEYRDRMRHLGMIAFDVTAGTAAFSAGQSRREPQVAPLVVDFPALVNRDGANRRRPFVTDVLVGGAPGGSGDEATPTRLKEELASTPKARRPALIVARIKARALRTLGLPPSFPLDPRRGLRDVGLDSLMAVELRNALQQLAETTLPATLLFDHPTVEALARYLEPILLPPSGALGEQTSVAAATADDRSLEAALRSELSALHAERKAGP